MGRAGQSQAPLSCAAQGRPTSWVASARTLGSRTRGRAMLQQEVRLRRELEQPRRGKATNGASTVGGSTRVMTATPLALYRRLAWVAEHRPETTPPPLGTQGPREHARPPRGRLVYRTPRRGPLSSRVSGAAARLSAESEDMNTVVLGRAAAPEAGSAARSPWLRGLSVWRGSTLLSNPSLNTRPREACRPCAAQVSRRLHCPARRKGATPHGSR